MITGNAFNGKEENFLPEDINKKPNKSDTTPNKKELKHIPSLKILEKRAQNPEGGGYI